MYMLKYWYPISLILLLSCVNKSQETTTTISQDDIHRLDAYYSLDEKAENKDDKKILYLWGLEYSRPMSEEDVVERFNKLSSDKIASRLVLKVCDWLIYDFSWNSVKNNYQITLGQIGGSNDIMYVKGEMEGNKEDCLKMIKDAYRIGCIKENK